MATTSVAAAAEALQAIAAGAVGERARRASALALVLRAVGAGGFVRRRAAGELERVEARGERSLMRRVLEAAEAGEMERLRSVLVEYGCELEGAQRLPEADAVMSLALATGGETAEVALHAGRIARKQGARERALELYRRARALDGEGGHLGRLAAVGEAVVSERAETALGRVVREAVRAGDGEAAAVGLEERSRLRRTRGERSGALRDLWVAAMRFPDPVDRARVAHEMADVCGAAGDAAGAREALLVALLVGDATQREHAQSRLHGVCRDMRDEVGMRRWRSFARPALVSLSPGAGRGPGWSAARQLARWRWVMEEAS